MGIDVLDLPNLKSICFLHSPVMVITSANALLNKDTVSAGNSSSYTAASSVTQQQVVQLQKLID